MKEVYASLYQVVTALLATILVITVLYLSNTPKDLFIVISGFLMIVLVITLLSYKEKIPLYKIKE